MPTVELILTPGDTTVASNTVVQYSTQGSYCTDGTDLTYVWAYTTPISGSNSYANVESDGETYTLYTDINGGYTVTVTATSTSGATATKTVRLLVISDVTYMLREKEHVDIIGDTIGDFWKFIDNKEVFATMWDEYAKCVSADYRYLADTFLSRSISTINSGKVVTDTVVSTEYDIPEGECIVKPSNSFFGNNAATEDSIMTGVASSNVGMTDTVYLPADSVGGDGFFSKKSSTQTVTVSRSGRVTVINPNYWFSQANVKVLTGRAAGKRTNLVSFGNEFVLDPMLPEIVGQSTEAVIRVRIEKESFASNLLLTVDGISAPIKAVKYYNGVNGKVAGIQVSYKAFPGNKTNLPWRICNTLRHSSAEFEQNGVSPGDVLSFRMASSYNNFKSTIHCLVVGSYKNMVSFEITDSLLQSNGIEVGPSISDATFYGWMQDFSIPGSSKNVDGTYSFKDLALLARQSFNKASALHVYNDIYQSRFVPEERTDRFLSIYVTTSMRDNAIFRMSYAPVSIRRNTFIPLPTEDRVLSCGVITEYVYGKESSQTEDGRVAVIHEDGLLTYRDSAERILYENVHYVIANKGQSNGSFNKAAGTLRIVDSNGFFESKGIQAGYKFLYDGSTYYVSQVVSETELDLVESSNIAILKNIKLIDEFYTLQRPRTSLVSFLRVVDNLYSYENYIPTSLYIPATVVSNDKRVENNFGVLAEYMLSDYKDYSPPTLSYVSAVMGLMQARLLGTTRSTAKVVASIITNAAITESLCVVRKIDKTAGKVTVELLGEGYRPTSELITYKFAPQYSTPPFRSIAIHPVTNEEIAVGDVLTPFTCITGKVRAEDYYTYPELFTGLGIQKYHSWYIMLAAEEVKSKEIVFLQRFFKKTAPAHVKLQTLYVVTLLDTVYVTDDVEFNGTLKLIDSSSLSSESAAIVDARNGSDQVLTALGLPDLSTRTLFLGRDLVATSSSTVVSPRGGFALGEATTISKDPPFEGTYNVLGGSLVKSGDILRIYSGINAGVFIIDSVISNTELSVSPFGPRLPYTPTVLTETDTSATYAVFRPTLDYILDGLTPSSVDGSEATFIGEDFIYEHITVGDVVVDEADHTNRFYVVSVNEESLEISGTLSTNTSYVVYREANLYKEYAQNQQITYSATHPTYVAHTIPNAYLIEVGDTLLVADGPNITQTATITYTGHGYFLLDRNVLTSGCLVTLSKEWLPDEGQIDYKLEKLHGFDKVSSVLTSTSAICTVSTKQTGPNGLEYFTVYGAVNASAGDLVSLYDGSTLMLESRVWKLDALSDPECIVLFENSSINQSDSYSVVIEKSL